MAEALQGTLLQLAAVAARSLDKLRARATGALELSDDGSPSKIRTRHCDGRVAEAFSAAARQLHLHRMMAGAKMARRVAITALAITLLAGVFLWVRNRPPPADATTQTLSPPTGSVAPTSGEATQVGALRDVSPSMAPPGAQRSQSDSRTLPAVRMRRQQVLDALAAGPASAASNAPPAPAPRNDGEPAGMRDRTGVMPETVRALNAQFGPLVDQCFDQAQERGVNQHGMVGLAVKLASADGLGTIIETIEPTATNEVNDAELIDCLRQSAFTVDLPTEGNGRTEFQMTIPYQPTRGDAGAPSGAR